MRHKPMSGQNILISFSGGKTSAFMTKFLIDNFPDNNYTIVFANTGKETEQTLDFVNQCDIRWGLGVVWVEAKVIPEKGKGTTFKIVNYETASRDGKPFEDVIKKYGIPNKMQPHCTRELKIAPIHKYIKSIGISDYYTAIGIRADETSRINAKISAQKNFIYPLAHWVRADKRFINAFWDSQPFNLNLKSYEGNCDFCWKKTKRKLLTLAAEKPDIVKWWVDMELKYGAGEYTFFREKTSGIDLLQMSKGKFRKSIDEYLHQNTLFAIDEGLDSGLECFCKSI